MLQGGHVVAGQRVTPDQIGDPVLGDGDAAINVDIDLSSLPFFGGANPFPDTRGGRSQRRMTGWV